jgi:hypothetical protein
MKFILFFILIVALLFGYMPMKIESTLAPLKALSSTNERLSQEQESLSRQGADTEEILVRVRTALANAATIQTGCEHSASWLMPFLQCKDIVDQNNNRAAEMYLKAAKYAEDRGDKVVAHQLYAEFANTFTGKVDDSYFVKAKLLSPE